MLEVKCLVCHPIVDLIRLHEICSKVFKELVDIGYVNVMIERRTRYFAYAIDRLVIFLANEISDPGI